MRSKLTSRRCVLRFPSPRRLPSPARRHATLGHEDELPSRRDVETLSQVRVVLDLSLLKALSTMGSSDSLDQRSLEIGSSARLRATFNDLRTQARCDAGECGAPTGVARTPFPIQHGRINSRQSIVRVRSVPCSSLTSMHALPLVHAGHLSPARDHSARGGQLKLHVPQACGGARCSGTRRVWREASRD